MALNNFFFIIYFTVLIIMMTGLQFLRIKFSDVFWSKVQLALLLIYSYAFIGITDWRFVICIVIVSLFSFLSGLLISRIKSRRVLIMCCVILILFLGYFKYVNFFRESICTVLSLRSNAWNIILPLGISFYIFAALAYLIDIYRGTCEAETNIVTFGLFMAFFPKITAGPIVRWTDFRKCVKEYRGVKLAAFEEGIQIFVFGLFKKMVLADRLGVFVDDVFRTPNAFNTGTIILCSISYSLQIYLDFSGYSDMAIGSAKILGFDFKPNFNLPYIAKGFSDFWSRWHISLSQWFRDYLYYPLGGSRKGDSRTYLNLLIVMLVSGIWHGAGWTFILWGLFHGVASCITRIIRNLYGKLSTSSKWDFCFDILARLITFLFTTLFWISFRAESITSLGVFYKALFTIHSGIGQPYAWTFFAITCMICATGVAVIRSHKNKDKQVSGFYPILDLSKMWSLVAFLTFCGLTVLLGYYGNTAFIYGSF